MNSSYSPQMGSLQHVVFAVFLWLHASWQIVDNCCAALTVHVIKRKPYFSSSGELYKRFDHHINAHSQSLGCVRCGRHFVLWAFTVHAERLASARDNLYSSHKYSRVPHINSPAVRRPLSYRCSDVAPFVLRNPLPHSHLASHSAQMNEVRDSLSEIPKCTALALDRTTLQVPTRTHQSKVNRAEQGTPGDNAVGRRTADRSQPSVHSAPPRSCDAEVSLNQKLDNGHSTAHRTKDNCEKREAHSLPGGRCVNTESAASPEREANASFQAFFSKGRKRWISSDTISSLQPRRNTSENSECEPSVQNVNDAVGNCSDKELLKLLRQEAEGLPKELFEAFPRKNKRALWRCRRREALLGLESNLFSKLLQTNNEGEGKEFEIDFSDVPADGA